MPQHAPRFPRRRDAVSGGYYDDLAGCEFGAWTALTRRGDKWLCRCACGEERLVYGFTLRNGQSRSCGCQPRAPRLKLEEPRITAIIYKGNKFYAVLPTDASTVPRAMFQDLGEARAYRDAAGAASGLPSSVATDDAPRHTDTSMISSDSHDGPQTS